MKELIQISISVFIPILSFAIVGLLWFIDYIYNLILRLKNRKKQPIHMDLTDDEFNYIMSIVEQIKNNRR